MPNNPSVLVLLAAYNGERWIKSQIDSILSQEGVLPKVVIRDDCSQDGTSSLVQSVYADDSRVTVLSADEPSGSSGAAFFELYRCWDVSGYDYVALADQDDLWFPGKLKQATDKLRESGAVGYSCAVNAFWPDKKIRTIRQVTRTTKSDFLFEGAGQGCTFVLTQRFFLMVQEFLRREPEICLEMHYHDWYLYLLSRAWNCVWYFDEKPWMLYRQHASNEIGSRGTISAVQRRIEKIRSGWYRSQVLAACRVYMAAGGEITRVSDISDLFLGPRKQWRLTKGVMLLFNSRRRLSDRFVLFVSALIGWI